MERIPIESEQGNPERGELQLKIPSFYAGRTEITKMNTYALWDNTPPSLKGWPNR